MYRHQNHIAFGNSKKTIINPLQLENFVASQLIRKSHDTRIWSSRISVDLDFYIPGRWGNRFLLKIPKAPYHGIGFTKHPWDWLSSPRGGNGEWCGRHPQVGISTSGITVTISNLGFSNFEFCMLAILMPDPESLSNLFLHWLQLTKQLEKVAESRSLPS